MFICFLLQWVTCPTTMMYRCSKAVNLLSIHMFFRLCSTSILARGAQATSFFNGNSKTVPLDRPCSLIHALGIRMGCSVMTIVPTRHSTPRSSAATVMLLWILVARISSAETYRSQHHQIAVSNESAGVRRYSSSVILARAAAVPGIFSLKSLCHLPVPKDEARW